MNASTPIVPAYDTESRDGQILAAFERVRAARAYIYGFDDGPPAEREARQREFDRLDEAMCEDEGKVRDNVASTLPGVIARLLLLIPTMDQSRWADRDLVERGFLAVYREIDNLDGNAQQVAYAAHELIEIEWQQNLAAYEKAAGDFDAALRLKALVDRERFRQREAGTGPSPFLQSLVELANELEARFSNEAQIMRLLRTLTPDLAAYNRKVEIAVTEDCQNEVAVWLARDANYLIALPSGAGTTTNTGEA